MQLAPTSIATSPAPPQVLTPLRPGGPTSGPAKDAVAQVVTTFFNNFGLQRLLDVRIGASYGRFDTREDALKAIAALKHPTVGLLAHPHAFEAVELLVANMHNGIEPPANERKSWWKDIRYEPLVVGADTVKLRRIESPVRLLPGSPLEAIYAGGVQVPLVPAPTKPKL